MVPMAIHCLSVVYAGRLKTMWVSGVNSVNEDISSSVGLIGDSIGCVGLISMMVSSDGCLAGGRRVGDRFDGGCVDERCLLGGSTYGRSRFLGSPPKLRRMASA